MKHGILLPNGKTVVRKIRYDNGGAWVRINKVDFGIEKLDENDKLEETLLILTVVHSKLDSKYINKISSKDESVWANYQMCRKTPPFRAGDIRRVGRICVSN